LSVETLASGDCGKSEKLTGDSFFRRDAGIVGVLFRFRVGGLDFAGA
jgi:hypothetical protein